MPGFPLYVPPTDPDQDTEWPLMAKIIGVIMFFTAFPPMWGVYIIIWMLFFEQADRPHVSTCGRLNYRVLVVDLINYVIFASMFAACYLGNNDLVAGPDTLTMIGEKLMLGEPEKLTTALDALYFSIVTTATLGYGDFRPEGYLRGVAVVQVLFGLFMIVIIIGVLLGERRLYMPQEERIVENEKRTE